MLQIMNAVISSSVNMTHNVFCNGAVLHDSIRIIEVSWFFSVGHRIDGSVGRKIERSSNLLPEMEDAPDEVSLLSSLDPVSQAFFHMLDKIFAYFVGEHIFVFLSK